MYASTYIHFEAIREYGKSRNLTQKQRGFGMTIHYPIYLALNLSDFHTLSTIANVVSLQRLQVCTPIIHTIAN